MILFLWCALPFLLAILSTTPEAVRAIMGASPFHAVFEPTAAGFTITLEVAVWFFVLTAQAERATTAAVRMG